MRFAKVTSEGEYVPPPPQNSKASFSTMIYVVRRRGPPPPPPVAAQCECALLEWESAGAAPESNPLYT